jgi:hypothetical protein
VIQKIQGGTFNTDLHEYIDNEGVWIPSLTQTLSIARYSNYDDVDPLVLRNAANRGTRCHWHTECYDTDGDMPPAWTPEEEKIRFEGYREWKLREGFVPEKVEFPLIFSVYGMKCACTVDRVGLLNGVRSIVELKFTYSPSKSWGIQLAAQEMAITNSTTIGGYQRVVCHVNSKGKARSIPHRDPYDAQRFIFALGVVYTRMALGQDVRREVMDE